MAATLQTSTFNISQPPTSVKSISPHQSVRGEKTGELILTGVHRGLLKGCPILTAGYVPRSQAPSFLLVKQKPLQKALVFWVSVHNFWVPGTVQCSLSLTLSAPYYHFLLPSLPLTITFCLFSFFLTVYILFRVMKLPIRCTEQSTLFLCHIKSWLYIIIYMILQADCVNNKKYRLVLSFYCSLSSKFKKHSSLLLKRRKSVLACGGGG